MADILFKIVTFEKKNGVIEPFVSERAVTPDLARTIVSVLAEEGLESAMAELREFTPMRYQVPEVFSITKALLKEEMEVDEDRGVAVIPVVALGRGERGEGIDHHEVSLEETETVNAMAWRDYDETVAMVSNTSGLPRYQARQIVDEIVKYLF